MKKNLFIQVFNIFLVACIFTHNFAYLNAQTGACDLLIPLANDLVANPKIEAFFIQNHPDGIKAYETLLTINSSLRTNEFALGKLLDDINTNPALVDFLKANPSKKDAWEMIHKSFYSHDIDVLNYVDKIRSNASVSSASSEDYIKTFFGSFPKLKLQGSGFVVHHAIEQQILDKWPNLFSKAEINSIENLRGISPEINPQLHLSLIRLEWNDFYNRFPPNVVPTKQQVLDKATEIDNKFGYLFTPPIRKL